MHLGLPAGDRRIEVVSRHPATGRRERDDRRRAAASRQLQRDVPAERIADEVRGLEARVVDRPLAPSNDLKFVLDG